MQIFSDIHEHIQKSKANKDPSTSVMNDMIYLWHPICYATILILPLLQYCGILSWESEFIDCEIAVATALILSSTLGMAVATDWIHWEIVVVCRLFGEVDAILRAAVQILVALVDFVHTATSYANECMAVSN
jgi:hypothetical protein